MNEVSKMNPEIKADWVESLRSGEYDQTYGALHKVKTLGELNEGQSPVGYCCLGVLSDLAKKAGVIESHTAENGTYEMFDGGMCFLSEKVLKWAGMEGHPTVRQPNGAGLTSLDNINDSEEYTFDEIADIIEAQLQMKYILVELPNEVREEEVEEISEGVRELVRLHQGVVRFGSLFTSL